MSLSEKSSELYFIVAVFPTHGLEEQLAAQLNSGETGPGPAVLTSSL